MQKNGIFLWDVWQNAWVLPRIGLGKNMTGHVLYGQVGKIKYDSGTVISVNLQVLLIQRIPMQHDKYLCGLPRKRNGWEKMAV